MQVTKPRAFVLMPFGIPFDAIYVDVIRPALEGAGYEVHRADDLGTHQNIMRDIVVSLVASQLIVGDLTGRNGNVMYEVGLAHAMEKPTVLITQAIDDIPFDLRAYRAIHYDLAALAALATEIADLARRHAEGDVLFGTPITDFVKASAATPREEIRELVRRTVESGRQLVTLIANVFRREAPILSATSSFDLKTASVDAALELALQIQRHADEAPADLAAFKRLSDAYYSSLEGVVHKLDLSKPENLRDLRALHESLLTSQRRNAGLSKVLRAHRDQLSEFKGHIEPLDHAIDAFRRARDDFAAAIAISDAVVERLVNLLEARLREAG